MGDQRPDEAQDELQVAVVDISIAWKQKEKRYLIIRDIKKSSVLHLLLLAHYLNQQEVKFNIFSFLLASHSYAVGWR